MNELSPAKQKILLLLLGGAAFLLSRTPQRQIRIVKEFAREWKFINKKKLQFEIRALYNSKLVAAQEQQNGSFALTLTEKGKMRVLLYHFRNMKIAKGKWDGNWRIVVFDIPEKLRDGRDALRNKLRNLGFYEFQKSVFVFPYQCESEIEFIIEFFGMRKYVRYGILSKIDNDLHLRTLFSIRK